MKNRIEEHPVFTFRLIYWVTYIVLLVLLNFQHPSLVALTIGIFGILSISRMVTGLTAILLVKYKGYILDVEPSSMLKVDGKLIG